MLCLLEIWSNFTCQNMHTFQLTSVFFFKVFRCWPYYLSSHIVTDMAVGKTKKKNIQVQHNKQTHRYLLSVALFGNNFKYRAHNLILNKNDWGNLFVKQTPTSIIWIWTFASSFSSFQISLSWNKNVLSLIWF